MNFKDVYKQKLTTAEEAVKLVPVSYTHLDVYKRQEHEGDSYQRLILDWGENLYDFLIQWFSQLLNELQKYDGDLPQKPKDGQQL